MALIVILAGPPGVGKSTSGLDYISDELEIINEDDIRFKYQKLGYPDFNEYAIHRARDTIRNKLIRDEDFAIELNLGYQHQYDYALAIKKFNTENKLNVILFFSDSVELCKARARERFLNGRHLVKPETVELMYQNTLPLLKTHIDHIDSLTLLNVRKDNTVEYVAKYNREENQLTINHNSAAWFRKEFSSFMESYINSREFFPGGLRRENDDDSDIAPRRGPKR